MALLLETTLGDLVIDLDVEGSPEICKNVLKLAKARYYTSTLFYNIQPNRFCQLGDPQGDGSGGACIYGLISTLQADGGKLTNERVLKSQRRFLKSNMGRPLTREECQEKGRVVATEMKGIPDTIGSQLLITISEGKDMALDGFRSNDHGDDRQLFRSVGMVREDTNHVLDQLAAAYCDAEGRPYADIRVIRALVVDDPFDDPPGMDDLMKYRGVITDSTDENRIISSPEYDRPPEEQVEIRIQADQIDPFTGEEDLAKMRQQEEEMLQREDKSRAVVLEMLGDLPDAEAKAPENVLFVCKLNPVTEDEDLELIFSRFDEKVKAEIIRDHDTGTSLQYAFVEFTTPQQAVEAYFKMNNALVDDRRIKVDFSQSVAKVWNKFAQRMRHPSSGKRSNQHMPRDPFQSGGAGNRPTGPRSREGGTNSNPRSRNNQPHQRPEQRHDPNRRQNNSRHFDNPKEVDRREFRDEDSLDSFGRRRPRNRGEHDRGDRDQKHKQGNHQHRESSPVRHQSDKQDNHHHRKSSPLRHESDSDSREERHSRRRRRSRSRSSDRRKEKKKRHRRHKSDRKRRHEESPSDSDQSSDSERRRRHRKRERRSRNGDDNDRGDRSHRKSADDKDDRHHKDRRAKSDKKSAHKNDNDRHKDRRERSNSPDTDDDDHHKERRARSDRRGSEKNDKDLRNDRRARSDKNKGDRSDDDEDRVRKHERLEQRRQSHRADDRNRR